MLETTPFAVPMGTKVAIRGLNLTVIDAYIYGTVEGPPEHVRWVDLRLRKYVCLDEMGQRRYYDEAEIEKAVRA